MIKPMKTIWHMSKLMILFGLMILLASACQPSGNVTTTDGADGDQGSTLELTLGTGPFFLADGRVGLADLSSYTATLVRSFDGSLSGEPQQWTETYVMRRDNETAASQMTIDTSGDNPQDPIFVAEIGENGYTISGTNDCLAESVETEISSIERIDPAGLLSVLLGADEAGQEDIGGVLADHYTFDERALGLFEMAESTGEIWVAVDGGHVLKYVLTTAGEADAFGEGIEGTLTWDYALTEISNTVLPALPEGCQLNVPLLADATNVLHTPYWLAYATTVSVAEAASFYQEQLPGFGWTLQTGPFAADANTFMEFTQGDQTIGVHISMGEAVTEVNIVLYSAGE